MPLLASSFEGLPEALVLIQIGGIGASVGAVGGTHFLRRRRVRRSLRLLSLLPAIPFVVVLALFDFSDGANGHLRLSAGFGVAIFSVALLNAVRPSPMDGHRRRTLRPPPF